MRLQNNMAEYMSSKNIEEIKDGMTELVEKENISKAISLGNYIMWSFSQTVKDVQAVNDLIILLKEKGFIESCDIEDG